MLPIHWFPQEQWLLASVDVANDQRVSEMIPAERRRDLRRDLFLAAIMVVGGLAISSISLARLAGDNQQMAQVTPPLQSTPGADTKSFAPAEPVTTGARPSEVAPEPARPDAEAQQSGAQPALPPAPAEKSAAPIKER